MSMMETRRRSSCVTHEVDVLASSGIGVFATTERPGGDVLLDELARLAPRHEMDPLIRMGYPGVSTPMLFRVPSRHVSCSGEK